MRQCSRPAIPDDSAVVENLLKFGRGFLALASGKVGLRTNIRWKETRDSGVGRNYAVLSRGQRGFQAFDRNSRFFAIERQCCLNRRHPQRLDLRIERSALIQVSCQRFGFRSIAAHSKGKRSFYIYDLTAGREL